MRRKGRRVEGGEGGDGILYRRATTRQNMQGYKLTRSPVLVCGGEEEVQMQVMSLGG